MDRINHSQAHVDVLEQQMKVMGAYTRMVKRRLRWWRGIAWGVALGLLGMALGAMPVGAAPFAYVAHECGGGVSVLDTATHTVVTTISITGTSGDFGLAITPD